MASVRAGSIFDIPIRLGVSFLLVLPIVAYLIGTQVGPTVEALNAVLGAGLDPAPLTDGPLPWILGAAAALGLFAGVFLHELGHSLVARRYGLDIESITLWFLGGIARFERFPDDWRQELAIAIAGPIVSVALGVLCYAAFLAVPESLPAVRFVLGYLAILNVVLAAFNMLPGFPMDGGRVLRALLARSRPRVQATNIAAQVGKAFALALGIAGILLFQVFWIAIAFFIYIGATSEARQTVLEAAFEGVTAADVMTPAEDLDTVTSDTTLDVLVERMITERHTGYPVVSDSELVGIVTLEDVQRVDPGDRAETTVERVMSTDLATVAPDTEAAEILTMIQNDDIGRVLVTGPDGGLIGLISRTDMMTVFEIVQGSQSASADRIVTG